MELVSKKVLILLCSLFFAAAAIEGLLPYQTEGNGRFRDLSLRHDVSGPFAFQRNPLVKRFFDEDTLFSVQLPATSMFEESFNFGGPRREDIGSEVRLNFDIKGHEKGSFDVKVSQLQITIIGKDDQKSAQRRAKGFWFWKKDDVPTTTEEIHWNQTQSFPLPADVDAKSYTVERTNSDLVIIFKKLKLAGRSEESSSQDL